jgi:hypothetical protein
MEDSNGCPLKKKTKKKKKKKKKRERLTGQLHFTTDHGTAQLRDAYGGIENTE